MAVAGRYPANIEKNLLEDRRELRRKEKVVEKPSLFHVVKHPFTAQQAKLLQALHRRPDIGYKIRRYDYRGPKYVRILRLETYFDRSIFMKVMSSHSCSFFVLTNASRRLALCRWFVDFLETKRIACIVLGKPAFRGRRWDKPWSIRQDGTLVLYTSPSVTQVGGEVARLLRCPRPRVHLSCYPSNWLRRWLYRKNAFLSCAKWIYDRLPLAAKVMMKRIASRVGRPLFWNADMEVFFRSQMFWHTASDVAATLYLLFDHKITAKELAIRDSRARGPH